MRVAPRAREGAADAGSADWLARHLRIAPVFPRRLRDHWLEGHAAEVSALALTVGRSLELSEQALVELELAARLHDVGKRAIPVAILNKPGPLSQAEWGMMRRHCEWGSNMLAEIPGLGSVAEAVRAHHERWDGTGYPRGLAGEEVPLASRIVAVCDAFSAMTTERPYRAARSTDDAVAEVRFCSGSQFDPRVVDALIPHVEPAAAA
jgi:HD-GYP domain-containing protein (c-di-GMP phosphodiesterase class II)